MIHRAKKSLGQNFLKSPIALEAMCTEGNVGLSDTVLEIGPGKGALTRKLLEKARNVIAIEKDRDLASFLREEFSEAIENKKLILIEGDVLEFEPTRLGLQERGYKLIANIPYNITGSIIRKFLSKLPQPSDMVLLVQKEVAERIVARDNKESILSLSVKAYGVPQYIMKVGKRFFSPAPKVDSAIIAIRGISRNNFKNKGVEDIFFKIIKAGFLHKRKVLRKNLEEVLLPQEINVIFETHALDSNIRAEDVPFTTWLAIASSFDTTI